MENRARARRRRRWRKGGSRPPAAFGKANCMSCTRQHLQEPGFGARPEKVTVNGISGMSLANTQDVIRDRARGKRDEIPSIQSSLAGSGGSEMVAQHRGLPT